MRFNGPDRRHTMPDKPSIDFHALAVIRPAQPWPGATVFCTTRAGGTGTTPYDSLNLGLGAGDDARVVHENRARLRPMLAAEPFWLRQVHGSTVADADVLSPIPLGGYGGTNATSDPPEADAAVTTTPGRVLAILTADCLPVVIGDDQGRVLGAAHAGWRGLAGGVLEATLAAMRRRAPHATAWRAWIGPGIGATAFQVGDDVRVAFAQGGAEEPGMFVADPTTPGKWLADLAGLARWRLKRLGVTHIESSGLCTVTDTQGRFFSYRRDGRTGRMATLAWLHDA